MLSSATSGYFLVFTSVLFFCGCYSSKVSTRCGKNCEKATLYYLPDCKEIKGFVNLDKTGLQRVFQHDIPEEFRKDSFPVCIRYDNVGVGILMSDCLQSEIIKIRCIREGW